METDHATTSSVDDGDLSTIASLRPPKIPVVLNRRALMQRDAVLGDCIGLIKTIHSADAPMSGSVNAERLKAQKELTRAHRSLEILCDRLWIRQNELYSQLCAYHRLKREAARRVYQLQQDELRKQRRIDIDNFQTNSVASLDEFFVLSEEDDSGSIIGWSVQPDPLDEAGEKQPSGERLASRRNSIEGSQDCAALGLLQNAHMDTILKNKDANAVRMHTMLNLKQPTKNITQSLQRSATDGAKPQKNSLPPIKEFMDEPYSRPSSISTRSSAKLDPAATPKPLSHWLREGRSRNSIERKILEQPFTVYRRDERGDFIPRGTMPVAFQKEMPSNKGLYRRQKLLEIEKQKFQSCIKRADQFKPEVSSISLKQMRSSADLDDLNTRRGPNYEFIAWVPM